MTLGIKQGVTYYTDCQNLKDLVNPIIDNDVNMRHKGHFTPSWDKNDLTFDNFGYGLRKTRANQGRLFCSDASRLFSSTNGYVGLTLELPDDIHGGVYHPLRFKEHLEFNEHLLFGVNTSDKEITYPGIRGVLTANGIEFTIWNRNVNFSIYDTFSNISKNTTFTVEFIWKSDGLDDFEFSDGYLPTMVIRVNGEEVVFGNPPLIGESFSDLNCYLLDTPNSFSNLDCIIKRIVIGNEIPVEIIDEWQSSSTSSSSSLSSSSSSGNVFRTISFNDLNIAEILNRSEIDTAKYSSVSVQDDLLQFSLEKRSFKYMWLPNSTSGTVSKIDVSTATSPVEVARYKTGSSASNPSRTAVTADGSLWIANRGPGSAVKIGLTDVNSCRNECFNTSTGPSDVKDYSLEDAILLELSISGETVGLPGQTVSSEQPRSIVEDANGNIWVHSNYYGLNNSWFKITGDGGYNGDGSLTKYSCGSEQSYGSVCSLSNNHIWSIDNGNNRAIRIFNADSLDPIGEANYFTVQSDVGSYGKGSYGIAYSRGYVYMAPWLPADDGGNGGSIDRFEADPIIENGIYTYSHPDVILYWCVFQCNNMGTLYPRHHAVYTRNDSDVDEDRTEDLFTTWYRGNGVGALTIIKNHKQYVNGAAYPFDDTFDALTTPETFVKVNCPSQITQTAGVGIMYDSNELPYAWVLSHDSAYIAAWDITNDEWVTFENNEQAISIGSAGHYNYNNFTGTVDEINVLPTVGQANYIIDSGSDGAYWKNICAVIDNTDSSAITFHVAASDDKTDFGASIEIQNCEDFNVEGRYLNFTILFRRDNTAVLSPTVRSFDVEFGVRT